MYFPKANYKTVKTEDRADNRLVNVSAQEAKALRTNLSLKQSDGWATRAKDSKEDDDKFEDERVARETYDMLNELLRFNKEQNQADIENPLNLMNVPDFLKPSTKESTMF